MAFRRARCPPFLFADAGVKKGAAPTRLPHGSVPSPRYFAKMLLHHGKGLTVRYLRHGCSATLPRIETDHTFFRRAKVTRPGNIEVDRGSPGDERSGHTTSGNPRGGKHVPALASASGYRGSQNVIQQASSCGRWRAGYRSPEACEIRRITKVGICRVISELSGIDLA